MSRLKKIIIVSIGLALVAGCIVGCKSKIKMTTSYYESGKVQAQIYENESGFHFFSDGAGKVISPELSVNGVQF